MHEIRNESLLDYDGDFDLNGFLVIGPFECQTTIRSKNMDDFEIYMNAIDIDYDSEDVSFIGCIKIKHTSIQSC